MKECRKKKFGLFSFLRASDPFLLLGDPVLLISLSKNWLSHYLPCLIVNGLCHVSLLILASENSNRLQFSLGYLPQPISWVRVSWTAPRPSEHSLPCSRGFSVAVMRCVHKVAALLHFPTLFNGAEGALVKLAFLSCHLECHVPEESPRASVVWLLPPDTSLTTNVDPCQISVFEAAVIFRVGLRAWKIPWTEEPGRLQSMPLHRVGHDLVISLSLWERQGFEKVTAVEIHISWRAAGFSKLFQHRGLTKLGVH